MRKFDLIVIIYYFWSLFSFRGKGVVTSRIKKYRHADYITNLKSFAFVVFLIFKLLGRKEFMYKQKR